MHFRALLFLLLIAPLIPLQACNVDIYANENMKPKVYLENGQPKGILVEMLDYIGKDIGCQFNYKFSTWARAYKSMLDGDGAVIGLSKTQSREDIIDYSDVMYMEDVLLVTHINNAFDYQQIDDLASKKVLMSRGVTFDDEFEAALNNKLFTAITDNGDIGKRLERIAKQRADVAIISPGKFAFNNAILHNSKLQAIKDKLYIVPTVFRKDPNYLGFAKTHDNRRFLLRFNHSMKKARASGIFQKIEEKYHHIQP